MNHEREKEIPHFDLDTGKERLICTPENTLAFLYENSEYDHIFYIKSQEEDTMHGFHIFRHLLGDNFDQLVMKMINEGYAVSNEEEITKSDFEAYKKSLPDYYELPDPEENWGPTKMRKAENLGKFIAYLAEQIANGKDESTF